MNYNVESIKQKPKSKIKVQIENKPYQKDNGFNQFEDSDPMGRFKNSTTLGGTQDPNTTFKK